jgi:hypothetical protein
MRLLYRLWNLISLKDCAISRGLLNSVSNLCALMLVMIP